MAAVPCGDTSCGGAVARHRPPTLLVALDVHPRVTMAILRHSQIAVTMDVYSQVATASTQEALRRLGEQRGPGDAARPLLYFAAVPGAEKPFPVAGKGL